MPIWAGCPWTNGWPVFPIRDLNPTRITPVMTLALIAINVLVWLLWQPHGSVQDDVEFLYERSAIACEVLMGRPLTFDEINGQMCDPAASSGVAFPEKIPLASLFVSMFLHGGLAHLLGNMWFLWLFGNNVEEAYGHLRYLAAYLVAGLVATFGFVVLHPDNTTPLIGASGAIAGVLGSYLVLFPGKMVMSLAFFMVIPVPAVLFLGLWFLGQFAIGDAGVAWEAHVTGFVVGVVVAVVFRAPLLARVRQVAASPRHARW